MKLTQEEAEILKDFEEGRLFPSVTDKEVLQKFVTGAEDFGRNIKTVSIRLSEEDFDVIRIKAVQKNMPFEAFIRFILHQYILTNN